MTLGEALPNEVARVRDEILPLYEGLGRAGAIAAAMMREDLDLASKVMIEGDVAGMICVLAKLKEWES